VALLPDMGPEQDVEKQPDIRPTGTGYLVHPCHKRNSVDAVD